MASSNRIVIGCQNDLSTTQKAKSWGDESVNSSTPVRKVPAFKLTLDIIRRRKRHWFLISRTSLLPLRLSTSTADFLEAALVEQLIQPLSNPEFPLTFLSHVTSVGEIWCMREFAELLQIGEHVGIIGWRTGLTLRFGTTTTALLCSLT